MMHKAPLLRCLKLSFTPPKAMLYAVKNGCGNQNECTGPNDYSKEGGDSGDTFPVSLIHTRTRVTPFAVYTD